MKFLCVGGGVGIMLGLFSLSLPPNAQREKLLTEKGSDEGIAIVHFL